MINFILCTNKYTTFDIIHVTDFIRAITDDWTNFEKEKSLYDLLSLKTRFSSPKRKYNLYFYSTIDVGNIIRITFKTFRFIASNKGKLLDIIKNESWNVHINLKMILCWKINLHFKFCRLNLISIHGKWFKCSISFRQTRFAWQLKSFQLREL